MAAGFSMNKKNFNTFIKFLSELRTKNQILKKRYISKISSSFINIEFIKNLERLAPLEIVMRDQFFLLKI